MLELRLWTIEMVWLMERAADWDNQHDDYMRFAGYRLEAVSWAEVAGARRFVICPIAAGHIHFGSSEVHRVADLVEEVGPCHEMCSSPVDVEAEAVVESYDFATATQRDSMEEAQEYMARVDLPFERLIFALADMLKALDSLRGRGMVLDSLLVGH